MSFRLHYFSTHIFGNMARETLSAREYTVNPINAVSGVGGRRKDGIIREFMRQRDVYAWRLGDAEERYGRAVSNRERYAIDKDIEFLNQRIREMDANIAYIMRFT